jgi:hypothetical protein
MGCTTVLACYDEWKKLPSSHSYKIIYSLQTVYQPICCMIQALVNWSNLSKLDNNIQIGQNFLDKQIIYK